MALSSTPVTPNAVSFMGVGASAAAAFCYALPAWPWTVAGGLACQFGWHVLDGADGELARRTGRSSPTGEMVDGLCDYLSQLVVYATLAWILSAVIGPWAWAMAAASGVARAIQANSYESRRRTYQYWGFGRAWMRQTLSGDRSALKAGLAPLARAYVTLADWVAPRHPGVEQAMLARFGEGPEAQTQARALYRTLEIGATRATMPLSANARTIAIALSMLAGSPLYFFLYESVGLSLFLVWSLHVQSQADRALATALQGQASPVH